MSSTPIHKALSLICLFLTIGGTSSLMAAPSPIQPDSRKTPGDVLTQDARVICVPGYTKTVRNVPQGIKEQVYRSYVITSRQPREYEVDHLISLELIVNFVTEIIQNAPT
jgi:hypothetical protein